MIKMVHGTIVLIDSSIELKTSYQKYCVLSVCDHLVLVQDDLEINANSLIETNQIVAKILLICKFQSLYTSNCDAKPEIWKMKSLFHDLYETMRSKFTIYNCPLNSYREIILGPNGSNDGSEGTFSEFLQRNEV